MISNPASVWEPRRLHEASVKLVTVLKVSICSPVQIKTRVKADVDREMGRDETRQHQTRGLIQGWTARGDQSAAVPLRGSL